MKLFGYKYTVDPLLKILGAYFIILLLVAVIVLLSGCGVRKSSLDSSSHKTEQKGSSDTKQESGSKVEERESKEDRNTQESKNDVVTTETTKKYGSDGKLIEEHTKTISDKSTSKSTSASKSAKTSKNETWLNIRTKVYTLEIVTTKSKKKDVEADKSIVTNMGGWGVPLILGIIVIAAVFVWFYLKRR